MAIQTGLITLTGKSGNQINYQRNGKHYTKGVAKNIKRTEASKRSSAEFGAASKVASLINTGFLPLRKELSDWFSDKSGLLTYDRRYYAGKIIKTFTIINGELVHFLCPEPEITINEPAKENRISWKLHK